MVMRRSVMNPPIAYAMGVAMALGLMANLAGAQTTADKDKPQGKDWNTGLNAGLNLTRGNSKTLMLNGGLISE